MVSRALIVGVAKLVCVPWLGIGTQRAIDASGVLSHHSHGEPMFAVRLLHQSSEALVIHRDLRDAYHMRRIPLFTPLQGRRSRQPAGVTAHDFQHRDRRRRAHRLRVTPRAHRRQSNKTRRAAVARCMVGAHKVVVDGLGHIHDPKWHPGI